MFVVEVMVVIVLVVVLRRMMGKKKEMDRRTDTDAGAAYLSGNSMRVLRRRVMVRSVLHVHVPVAGIAQVYSKGTSWLVPDAVHI
jgi:hypothetical protein